MIASFNRISLVNPAVFSESERMWS